MRLYIRPIYMGERLTGYALCRIQKDQPLVDEDVVEHFDLDYSGKMIREAAIEFHDADSVEWGDNINIKEV